MGTLRELKTKMRLNKDLRQMLVRSSRYELMIDLDGDKVADIALIDSNRDGDLDMLAVDATGNGDFNLYVGDQDGNGIPDTVEFYVDGEDIPEAAFFGKNVEDGFVKTAEAIYARLMVKELVAADIIAAFEEFVDEAKAEYEKLQQA